MNEIRIANYNNTHAHVHNINNNTFTNMFSSTSSTTFENDTSIDILSSTINPQ